MSYDAHSLSICTFWFVCVLFSLSLFRFHLFRCWCHCTVFRSPEIVCIVWLEKWFGSENEGESVMLWCATKRQHPHLHRSESGRLAVFCVLFAFVFVPNSEWYTFSYKWVRKCHHIWLHVFDELVDWVWVRWKQERDTNNIPFKVIDKNGTIWWRKKNSRNRMLKENQSTAFTFFMFYSLFLYVLCLCCSFWMQNSRRWIKGISWKAVSITSLEWSTEKNESSNGGYRSWIRNENRKRESICCC